MAPALRLGAVGRLALARRGPCEEAGGAGSAGGLVPRLTLPRTPLCGRTLVRPAREGAAGRWREGEREGGEERVGGEEGRVGEGGSRREGRRGECIGRKKEGGEGRRMGLEREG